MEEMRDIGLFSDSDEAKDPYLIVYVETNVENPDLFNYLWDRTEAQPKYVNNCREIKNGKGDRWNEWKSLIVVAASK